MLHHFRKYQQYIFLVITAVIILSFSFFGTGGVIETPKLYDEPVFRGVGGTTFNHKDLNEMALFIATDQIDANRYQGVPGPNFLNDGVIDKDFLKTGLMAVLLNHFQEPLKADLESRASKEKHYTPYINKQAPFLNAENVWNYFAKGMGPAFRTLKASDNPLSKESFDARVTLYQNERLFPANFVKQFLRYQQSQYNWIKPDPELEYLDLSLFNYHTFEDWFGPRFVKLIAEVILNGSDAAVQAGYKVTKEEALADLKKNNLETFKMLQKNSRITVKNPEEFFQEQLRRLGMDKNQAIKNWQKILLFRRYMQDVSSSVFVASLPFETFDDYAKKGMEGDVYTLKKEFQFETPKEFELFEIYLSAILKNEAKSRSLLLPSEFKTASMVAKDAPSLVENRYQVELAEVDTLNLLGKITLREAWKWESQSQNWPLLVKEFPELGLKKAVTDEERLSALDSVSTETRSRIDYFARKEILRNNSALIEQAFEKAEFTPLTLNVNMSGESKELPQVNEIDLKEALTKLSSQEIKEVSLQSKDGKKRYELRFVSYASEPRILTFKEAKEKNVLEPMLTAALKKHYEKIRETNPKAYKGEEGGWKKLAEVELQVANDYFKDTLDKLHSQINETNLKESQIPKDLKSLYPYRFSPYMTSVLKNLKDNKTEEFSANDENVEGPLENQWKLVKTAFIRDRRSKGAPEYHDLNKMEASRFSPLIYEPSHGLYFFYAHKDIEQAGKSANIETALSVQELVGNEAMQNFFELFINQIKEKQALESAFFSGNEQT